MKKAINLKTFVIDIFEKKKHYGHDYFKTKGDKILLSIYVNRMYYPMRGDITTVTHSPLEWALLWYKQKMGSNFVIALFDQTMDNSQKENRTIVKDSWSD